ncbi:chemotaxis protein [Rhodobacterales bacterium HKCCE2091]|nr:chemotaxis protein [Rhodobacterales bacterium HKCCE2091]
MTVSPGPFGAFASSRPELSDRDFGRVANIARSAYGIQLEPQKKAMIQSRLTKRLRARGLADFSAYCALLETRGNDEQDHFISAITTNVTHFYREVHHFKQLQTEVLPPLVERARGGGRVRLWSAGCSTGPEPYSLAGSILKLFPEAGRKDIRILATDLDRDVLAKAEAATYDADQCDTPGPEWAAQVFEPSRGGGPRRIRREVAGLVSFQPVNLNGTWPMTGRFDVIMCRNVAIYFSREVQQKLWLRFAEVLAPGGHLFIGHSERLSGPATSVFEPCGITAYRKRA